MDGYRICSNELCNKLLPLAMFKALKGENKTWFSRECLKCIREKNAKHKRTLYKDIFSREKMLLSNRKHYLLNKEKIKKNRKLYYINNKQSLNKKSNLYGKLNRGKLRKYERQYRAKNKERIKIVKKAHRDNVLSFNLNYKIRRNISSSIRQTLKKNNCSKNKNSINSYISYSIQELKEHLENLFESWMNWDNWSIYNCKTWRDEDKSTWTWNIDHIVPHSEFNYTSMEDDSFKVCWALSNLRPYSSKQNIIDGSLRVRHAK